jgi:hypothetical protein
MGHQGHPQLLNTEAGGMYSYVELNHEGKNRVQF